MEIDVFNSCDHRTISMANVQAAKLPGMDPAAYDVAPEEADAQVVRLRTNSAGQYAART